MDVQVSGRFIEETDALGVQLRFQGARLRVIAAVNDAGVGTGSAHGNIVFLFQQTDTQIVPAQLSGCHTADHTGTDNGNVIPHEIIPLSVIDTGADSRTISVRILEKKSGNVNRFYPEDNRYKKIFLVVLSKNIV